MLLHWGWWLRTSLTAAASTFAPLGTQLLLGKRWSRVPKVALGVGRGLSLPCGEPGAAQQGAGEAPCRQPALQASALALP